MALVELSEVIPKFYGRYGSTLDDKGRASVPAKIREIIDLREIKTLMLRLFETDNSRFIRAYPASYFNDKILPMVSQFNEESEAGIYKMNSVMSSCYQIRLDNQGRINFPWELLESAKIEKEIKFLGLGDFFDIWNPELYEKFLAAGKNGSLKQE
jgi:MraZ protein